MGGMIDASNYRVVLSTLYIVPLNWKSFKSIPSCSTCKVYVVSPISKQRIRGQIEHPRMPGQELTKLQPDYTWPHHHLTLPNTASECSNQAKQSARSKKTRLFRKRHKSNTVHPLLPWLLKTMGNVDAALVAVAVHYREEPRVVHAGTGNWPNCAPLWTGQWWLQTAVPLHWRPLPFALSKSASSRLRKAPVPKAPHRLDITGPRQLGDQAERVPGR